nr:carbon-nitrogen hydrolase family protein [Amylibacter sp.]
MSRMLNLACLQTQAQPDFETALDAALTLARQATSEGAELLCLPEYCGGLKAEGDSFAPPVAEESAHPVLNGLRECAVANSVDILIGSIAVKGTGPKLKNRSFYIDKSGEILSRYDKIHLFDVTLSESETYRESDCVEPGHQAVVVDTRFGRFGHSICYDLRFPQFYRDLAQAGAEILLCPAAFAVPTGKAHWHVLNRARAIENGAFMVSPGAVGPVPGGGSSYGHSLVVNPWGEILADGGPSQGIVHAKLDLDLVPETRSRVPSLSHDRPYSPPATESRKVA